ncbi:hypothetical protein DY000_02044707, partial [Brassica cretica]
MALSYPPPPPPLAVPSSYPFHFLPSSSDPPYDILRTHPSLSLLSNCRTHQSLRETHAQMVKTGLHNTNYALSKLLELCVVSPHFDGLPYAVSVFETIQEPNLLIWNTMLRGLALVVLNLGREIHTLVDDHHGFGSSLKIVNAFIGLYSKCGDVEIASGLFVGLSCKDVVSWNTLIGGYTHMNLYKEALLLFQEMLRSGESPNDVTMLSVLPACAHLGAIDIGRWIHVYIDKRLKGVTNGSALRTSLIDMYAKCGDIEAAHQVFNSMMHKSLSSWNAMIFGFAMHGRANAAFDLFSRMRKNGIEPDDITLVGLLSACSHSGLLDLGRHIFKSVTQDYNITPKLEHYGCMIDLLGHAGLFKEAEEIIHMMPMEPDGVIWCSLLKACKMHGNLELAESFAQKLMEIEPENS